MRFRLERSPPPLCTPALGRSKRSAVQVSWCPPSRRTAPLGPVVSASLLSGCSRTYIIWRRISRPRLHVRRTSVLRVGPRQTPCSPPRSAPPQTAPPRPEAGGEAGQGGGTTTPTGRPVAAAVAAGEEEEQAAPLQVGVEVARATGRHPGLSRRSTPGSPCGRSTATARRGPGPGSSGTT